jgi:ADP-ribose pyrophosphatase
VSEERLRKSRRIYDGRILSLRVDEVELPSGRITEREIVEHPGVVAIVPLVDNARLLLVRQFRRAAGRTLLEIPAGTMEPNESVEDCLRRELAEEVGMRAARVEHLITFLASPGFLAEEVHVYLAAGLSPSPREREEEDLQVVPMTLAHAQTLIGTEIVDAKSIIGLLMVASSRGRTRG